MSQFYALAGVGSKSAARECDCLAHRFGNAGDQPYRRPRYPSDMTDAEWAVVRDAMPVPPWLEGRGGQPEGYCHRQMIDAVRYLVTGGITWRSMPADLPRWDRVYAFAKRWRVKGLLAELHDRLRGMVREEAGRDPEPTAAIIDSQSVKADAMVPAASRGYDGGKKINGRKRHVVVDCLGLLLAVMVTAASVTDRDAAMPLLAQVRSRFRRITLVWADGGYTGRLVSWARETLRLTLEIVKRSDDVSGFVVLPRRWVVERTLGWLMRSRRLVRDYESLPEAHEAMVLWSMTRLMTRRLAKRTG
ncbi:transposase [Streptomyces sp. 846.5]|nr:transposase [Streptomyces sp. 846.5]TDU05342.1 transposase [Streptomyces sp. 846.5]TDU05416.1 transposase [Streptomyces sp. 846.5]TDU05616.1 transposase [Streptomyces sp. 846.5]